ncbi:LysR substrate-binding domain-containing protein [uncultured Ruegeria sp.]|uniref:LysR substrate-binding domain-containing protein n=1 Tax=uncultured Ruegeria sp. TaxID=259304 RepID=UPI002613CEEF|nr:LysR substrate-binding domain-containing protein [uncultured Ruegeria sp.]
MMIVNSNNGFYGIDLKIFKGCALMDLPHPTWLRTFEAATRLGSFSAAAAELGLTPAAVSQQMRLLEKHLKTTLFERLPRGVALTDMGKAYAQPVRKGLSDMQVATAGLFGKTKRQQLKVRASISFAALIIAPRLNEFFANHPHIDVELSTFVWANRFQEGISDVDIRFGYGDWSDGRVTHLGHEFAVPVCHPDFLGNFQGEPTLDILAAQQIITIHGSESDWPQLFQQLDLSMPVQARVTRFDSSLMALQAISAGPGMAIVLESFAQSFIQRGLVTSPVTEKIAIRPAHFLVERDGSERRDEIRAFSDWIRTIYSDTAG